MSQALSQKAKGKQRADPLQPNGLKSAPSKDLAIRFTEGIPDLTVQVQETDTVKDIKANIRAARSDLKDRRLRLIHQGQLLADTAQLYPRIVSVGRRRNNSEALSSTYIDEEEGGSNEMGVTEHSVPGTNWLHCSVGPQLKQGEEEDGRIQIAQLKPLRGFDRLAAAGFSEQDIASIRLQFHTHSAGDYLDQEFEDQEEFDEHARVLEEQWIDSLDGPDSDLSNSQAAVSSLHNGIIFGFFFPLMPLFFFRGHKPAVFWDDGSEHDVMEEPLFSRRMQMGIIVGFLLNVLFGMWTYLLSSI